MVSSVLIINEIFGFCKNWKNEKKCLIAIVTNALSGWLHFKKKTKKRIPKILIVNCCNTVIKNQESTKINS